jgi:plasmid maintenance system killer protein
VPSDASAGADCVMPYPATKRAAVQLIETDSMSVIGPMNYQFRLIFQIEKEAGGNRLVILEIEDYH